MPTRSGTPLLWYELSPEQAKDIVLPHEGITGPLTMDDEVCPWPWDPILMAGKPIGQYHCPYCGEMVIAGMDHIDYRNFDKDYEKYMKEQGEQSTLD